jgi:hypothetical protein
MSAVVARVEVLKNDLLEGLLYMGYVFWVDDVF